MEIREFSGENILSVLSLAVVGVIQEHFKVTVCRCPLSGVISREEWRDHDGLLHRWDGPAIVHRERDTGIITERGFYWKGKLHHSDGEPAQMHYDERSGRLIRRYWLVHGEFSRPGNLPHIEWLDEQTGVVTRAEYRIRANTIEGSQFHREAGPALILFDHNTGQQIEATFYRFGRKQRAPCGPMLGT